jgi:SOS-response transcriptional repressor LexA
MSDLEERAERIIAVSPALAREIARRFHVEPRGLTRRQTEALEFLREFIARNRGVSPTYDETAAALGVSKTAAFKRILRIEERGHIRRLSNHCRSIVLVEEAA